MDFKSEIYVRIDRNIDILNRELCKANKIDKGNVLAGFSIQFWDHTGKPDVSFRPDLNLWKSRTGDILGKGDAKAFLNWYVKATNGETD